MMHVNCYNDLVLNRIVIFVGLIFIWVAILGFPFTAQAITLLLEQQYIVDKNLKTPADLLVMADDSFLVSDYQDGGIWHYSKTGDLLEVWQKPASQVPFHPVFLTEDVLGSRIFINDGNSLMVSIFSSTGQFIKEFPVASSTQANNTVKREITGLAFDEKAKVLLITYSQKPRNQADPVVTAYNPDTGQQSGSLFAPAGHPEFRPVAPVIMKSDLITKTNLYAITDAFTGDVATFDVGQQPQPGGAVISRLEFSGLSYNNKVVHSTPLFENQGQAIGSLVKGGLWRFFHDQRRFEYIPVPGVEGSNIFKGQQVPRFRKNKLYLLDIKYRVVGRFQVEF